MNSNSNWGDSHLMRTQVIKQEDYWLAIKILQWWQKRAFWNIFSSEYTMYIFHPYILTLVFHPWCHSPFFHAGSSPSFLIFEGKDCFHCLKNRKKIWVEYLGYSSSLTPSVFILLYYGKTRNGVPKPSLGLFLVTGIVAGVQSGGWYSQLLSFISSYRHHWRCSALPSLVVMATNASLPLFIWHLISRCRHYCPFIHKMPLEGKYPLFHPKDNESAFTCVTVIQLSYT